MQIYSDNVQDRYGNAIEGANVAITVTATGVPAMLYADNGITPIANPMKTDKNGEFFCFLARGNYTRNVTSSIAQMDLTYVFEVVDLLTLSDEAGASLVAVVDARDAALNSAAISSAAEDGAVVAVTQSLGYAAAAAASALTVLAVETRFRRTGAAAPTTGTWALGDVVYSLEPAPGGFIGWVCTFAGTPGTWKNFGAISA